MAQAQYIKDLYENEGLSLRQIAERTQHHFDTVRKYAYQDDWNQPTTPTAPQREFLAMGDYTKIVDGWLEQDEREPRKQRHTITKVFKRLQNECSYTGSYNSVKRYYHYKKESMKQFRESYVPLAHPAGHAQVDFGDFKYYDELGAGHTGHALIVAFPHANTGWMQVFPSENQECLLEGLKRIFYHIGGVPLCVRCDNMTTAVAQVLKGTERVLSDGFHRFMLHHRFAAEFCNPNKGNEKGSVENKVGYTRRNMLVPVPTITDFDAFNEGLLQLCDDDHEREHYQHGIPLKELWEEDKRVLLALPEYEYDVFRYDSLSVNKDGFIKVDTAKYSLSPELYGKVVQSKIYFDKIEVFHDHSLLKTFRRSYTRDEKVYDWRVYLPTLVKKPGATEHTEFFHQMPQLWQRHLKSTSGRERKSALMLLSEIVSDGNEALSDDVLELAGEYGRMDSDSLRQCYLFISKPENNPAPLQLATEPPLLNYRPDLTVYDGLTGGVAK